MVEPALGAGEEGDVVGRVVALQEGGELVAVVGQDLLGQPELEDLGEEPGGPVHVLAQQEDMVDAGRVHPHEVGGGGGRVELGQAVADLAHPGLEVHQMAAGGLEAHHRPRGGIQLAGMEAGRVAAGIGHPASQAVELVEGADLEAEAVEPVGGGGREDQRVVLVLVPPLEVGPLPVVIGDDQPHHLGVVGQGQLQVGDPHIDMRQPDDALRPPHASPLTPRPLSRLSPAAHSQV